MIEGTNPQKPWLGEDYEWTGGTATRQWRHSLSFKKATPGVTLTRTHLDQPRNPGIGNANLNNFE